MQENKQNTNIDLPEEGFPAFYILSLICGVLAFLYGLGLIIGYTNFGFLSFLVPAIASLALFIKSKRKGEHFKNSKGLARWTFIIASIFALLAISIILINFYSAYHMFDNIDFSGWK